MPSLRYTLAPGLLAVLAACASLTEAECRDGDWQGIGLADGAEGRGEGRLEAHRRACADAGVVPDAAEWRAGREAGLRLYCRPAKAYAVAREGRSLAEGCTAAELAALAPAYERGQDYWRIELEIDRLRGDIREIDRALASAPREAPGRGGLYARRSLLISRLQLAEMRQWRYAAWP